MSNYREVTASVSVSVSDTNVSSGASASGSASLEASTETVREYALVSSVNGKTGAVVLTVDNISGAASQAEVLSAQTTASQAYSNTVKISSRISAIEAKESEWDNKQDKLEAGDHITINDNVISSEMYDDTDVQSRLSTIEGKESAWDDKQDQLEAGDHITIADNVISSEMYDDTDVQSRLSAIEGKESTWDGKQDQLEAGDCITIRGNVISANGAGFVYDDTEVKERISTIEGKESTWDAKSDFSGSYNDLTDVPDDILTTGSSLDASKLTGTVPDDCYTDTTYSAGTGITLDAGTFSVTESDASEIVNQLTTGSSDPVDADYYVAQYAGGGTTTTTYHRRPHSALWNYIKGKISSILGLTATAYGGNAATATALGSDAGSATQPIYFSGGKPVATTYTLGKSVPSNAVFTDNNTTYSAGSGLSLSGTTFNHAATLTAGTVGTSSATSGSTLAVPYVTYNATGHITKVGTHTHTVSGFAASSHTHSYLPLSGGTMTGIIKLNGNRIYFNSYSNPGQLYATDGTVHFIAPESSSGANNFLNLQANYVQCRNTGDSAWSAIGALRLDTKSSRRYKTNIVDMDEDTAKKILDVDVVGFDYIDGISTVDRERYNRHGVIAEDVDSIIPEAVSYMDVEGLGNVPDAVDYSRFVPYLIKMIQIQQKEIDELKQKIS